MNKLLLISVLIFFWSCKREDLTEKDYPEEIIQNNLQEKFDIAKLELYKKLLNCKGYKYVDKDQKVANMISCELRYKGFKKQNDSITISFLPYCDTTDYLYISKDCEDYYGVGFIGHYNRIRYWEGGEPPYTATEVDYEYFLTLHDSLKRKTIVFEGTYEDAFKIIEKHKNE